jgi:hypothetical protein
MLAVFILAVVIFSVCCAINIYRRKRRAGLWAAVIIAARMAVLGSVSHRQGAVSNSQILEENSHQKRAKKLEHNYDHGPVHVDGYIRQDGTVVHSYTRRRPHQESRAGPERKVASNPARLI